MLGQAESMPHTFRYGRLSGIDLPHDLPHDHHLQV